MVYCVVRARHSKVLHTHSTHVHTTNWRQWAARRHTSLPSRRLEGRGPDKISGRRTPRAVLAGPSGSEVRARTHMATQHVRNTPTHQQKHTRARRLYRALHGAHLKIESSFEPCLVESSTELVVATSQEQRATRARGQLCTEALTTAHEPAPRRDSGATVTPSFNLRRRGR